MTLGFAGAEHAAMGLIQTGGRAYDPAQRRFLSPDPLVSDPYFDQARHRYSYVQNNPATFTDPTGYILPAWLCGLVLNAGYLTVGAVQFSFGSYSSLGGGPMSWPQVRATLPDVTPDSYRAPTPTGLKFTGPGYAGGDQVARALIDHGVDAWLQENGDAAINVSLGVSYAALTVATYGMAAEAGVFAGVSARVASFGASSWRTITGVAGMIGEGARRYGNQVTRWGAQVMRAPGGAGEAAPSTSRGAGDWQRFLPEAMKRVDAAKLKYGGEGVLNMARKADIKQIDRIVRQVGLSPAQREIFHEEMRALKGNDGLGSVDELLELAQEIKASFPNK